MKRLLVCMLVLLLAVVATPSAFADEQTVTVNTKVSTLLAGGKTALGSLVIKNTGTAQAMESPWTFTGQVDGNPASAAGLALGRWTGKGYEGNVTRVDKWDMGGIPNPKLPLAMSFLTGADGAVYSVVNTKQSGPIAIPLAVQGVDKLPEPFKGDLALSVTNVAGGKELRGLPRTGEPPAWLNWLALASLVLGAAALGAARRMLRAKRSTLNV